MKRCLVACFLFLALSRIASASIQGSLSDYVPRADSIYLVSVNSISGRTASFSVIDALRGATSKFPALDLEYPSDFASGSKWVILSTEEWRKGQRGNVLGSFFKGDVGWIYAPVFQDGTGVYVQGDARENGNYVRDKTINGAPWLTLDHLKRLIQEHPNKPDQK